MVYDMCALSAVYVTAMASYTIDVSRHILLLGSYSRDTQTKYLAAVTAFSLWLQSFALLPRSFKELDHHLSNYMADLWFAGKGKAEATCTFYGLDMFMPGLRYKLPVSLRSIRGFCPSVPHPPLPWQVPQCHRCLARCQLSVPSFSMRP